MPSPGAPSQGCMAIQRWRSCWIRFRLLWLCPADEPRPDRQRRRSPHRFCRLAESNWSAPRAGSVIARGRRTFRTRAIVRKWDHHRPGARSSNRINAVESALLALLVFSPRRTRLPPLPGCRAPDDRRWFSRRRRASSSRSALVGPPSTRLPASPLGLLSPKWKSTVRSARTRAPASGVRGE